MNFTYTLYPGNDRPPLKLYAVQGEAGSRTITIHLPGASVGGAAYAYVVKNDGHVVVIDCETTSSSVTFTLPLQACTAAGWQKVYLQILSDGSELRYDNISLFVEPCNIEGAVASAGRTGGEGRHRGKGQHRRSGTSGHHPGGERHHGRGGQPGQRGQFRHGERRGVRFHNPPGRYWPPGHPG